MLHEERRPDRIHRKRTRHRGRVELTPGLLGDTTIALEHASRVDQQPHVHPVALHIRRDRLDA